MADAPSGDAPRGRGGFGRGRGRGDRGRGDRGRGRGRGRGGRGGNKDEEEWVPCTKLGRLVKAGRIKSLEDIFLHSIPIKEHQIIDEFLKDSLKDEVMSIKPVQKQTSAGQRTRFKCFVAVGDERGHIGLGWKCSSEVATAIRGAITLAKLNICPVRRGYWGNKVGMPHTVPCKLTAKCGSVRVRLVPAPRGTGLVAAPVPRKVLALAGIDDCYTSARGHTRTQGNFLKATFFALQNSYKYLTPNLWLKQDPALTPGPFQQHTDFLAEKKAAVFAQGGGEQKSAY